MSSSFSDSMSTEKYHSLADFLKCSSKVILVILHLQCGHSHDVQHSSKRPQFKLSHLFLYALLEYLSCSHTGRLNIRDILVISGE